jgi:hypothetical protein
MVQRPPDGVTCGGGQEMHTGEAGMRYKAVLR